MLANVVIIHPRRLPLFDATRTTMYANNIKQFMEEIYHANQSKSRPRCLEGCR